MTRTVSPSPEQLSELAAWRDTARQLRDFWAGAGGVSIHLVAAVHLEEAADALESTQSEIARLTTALDEARVVAERLSIEAQLAAPTLSECRLRGKIGSCASDIFAALKGNQP